MKDLENTQPENLNVRTYPAVRAWLEGLQSGHPDSKRIVDANAALVNSERVRRGLS